MYEKTYYTPKMNKNYYGDSIVTEHGVPQERKTSANLFSFNISDMPTVIWVKNSLLEKINLLQLADDTDMIAEDLDTLKEIFKQVLDYSKSKFMVANLEKTFYLELRKNTENVPLIIDNDTTVHGNVIYSYK